jgi:colanic acid biosynthesis glycosyl transferase WcaI
MKILILNQAFYPDVVATAQYASDLATALTEAGHDVTALCSSRGYDDPGLRFCSQEIWKGIRIVRVRSTGLGKTSKWRRAADFSTFMASCALRLWSLPKFDVVVAMTSPPLISFLATLAVPARAHDLVVWSMDINPDEAIAAGWLQERSRVARVLSHMLLRSLRRARTIIALDRYMKVRIEGKGIDPRKIVVVPPWSQDQQVKFDAVGRDEFRAAHGLSDKFVVMYSGNHSPCHPLDTLLGAVARLSGRDDIAFCFVGGGSEFQKVQRRASDEKWRNVLCLPYQPIEKLSGSLSAADLHVVVMGDSFVGIVHPSKIYNVLAVRRPFLYIGPAQSHMCDIVRNVGSEAYFAPHGAVERVITNIYRAMEARPDIRPGSAELKGQFSRDALVRKITCAIEGCRQEHVEATVS